MKTKQVRYSKLFAAYLTNEQIPFSVIEKENGGKDIRFECPTDEDLFEIAFEFGKAIAKNLVVS